MAQFPIGEKKTIGLEALHRSTDLQHDQLVVEFEQFVGGRSVHVRDTYLDEKVLPNLRSDVRVRRRVVEEWDPDKAGRVLFGSKIGGEIVPNKDDTTALRPQDSKTLTPNDLLALLRNLR